MWYGDLIIFPAIFNTQNMGLIVFTKFLGNIQVLHKPILALLSGQWIVKYLLMSKLWINLFNPPRLSEQCFNELGINNILVLSNYQQSYQIIDRISGCCDGQVNSRPGGMDHWKYRNILGLISDPNPSKSTFKVRLKALHYQLDGKREFDVEWTTTEEAYSYKKVILANYRQTHGVIFQVQPFDKN